MRRLICRLRGHVTRTIMLPEDLFGPYVFSSIECSRCGITLAVGMDQPAQIRRLVELIDELRAKA